MDKAPDAFRTISEVADDLDIPQHVLRFWETRFTQIKPMKRSGGRRYYRPDDVDLLRGIRRLLYGEGYTIRGVQRILKENGIKAVQGLIEDGAAPAFAPAHADAAPASGAPIMARAAMMRSPAAVDEHAASNVEDAESGFDDSDDPDAAVDEYAEPSSADMSDADVGLGGGADEADVDSAELDADDDDGEDVAAGLTPNRAPEPAVRREPDVRPAPRVPPPLGMASAAPRVDARPLARTEPVMSRANPIPPPRAQVPPRPGSEPRVMRAPDRARLEAVLEALLAARQALDAAMKDGQG